MSLSRKVCRYRRFHNHWREKIGILWGARGVREGARNGPKFWKTSYRVTSNAAPGAPVNGELKHLSSSIRPQALYIYCCVRGLSQSRGHSLSLVFENFYEFALKFEQNSDFFKATLGTNRNGKWADTDFLIASPDSQLIALSKTKPSVWIRNALSSTEMEAKYHFPTIPNLRTSTTHHPLQSHSNESRSLHINRTLQILLKPTQWQHRLVDDFSPVVGLPFSVYFLILPVANLL